VGNGEDVLAGLTPQLPIRASAGWLVSRKINGVLTVAALRRNQIEQFSALGFSDKATVSDCFAAFFSHFHNSLLEVGAGLRDNENAPYIVANPAMFGLALLPVAAVGRALSFAKSFQIPCPGMGQTLKEAIFDTFPYSMYAIHSLITERSKRTQDLLTHRRQPVSLIAVLIFFGNGFAVFFHTPKNRVYGLKQILLFAGFTAVVLDEGSDFFGRLRLVKSAKAQVNQIGKASADSVPVQYGFVGFPLCFIGNEVTKTANRQVQLAHPLFPLIPLCCKLPQFIKEFFNALFCAHNSN
jgi:hypothetical protein